MMMRALRVPLVTLLVLMGPLAASAVAGEFTVSKLGTGRLYAVTPQIFKTTAGPVECMKATARLEFTALKFPILGVPGLVYTECTALGVPATVTSASYEFSASGSMTFAKAVTIEPEALGCTITFVKKGNSEREKVLYHKTGVKLQLELDLSALTYTTSGGPCGAGAASGQYHGTLVAEEEGGTIE